MTLKVLISHAHDEMELAKAWKTLLERISLGVIEVWFSSDEDPLGGVTIGKDWREDLYHKLSESNLILTTLTPDSVNRPWIMWECGVASGINKERRIIPIMYSMGRGDLANPLSIYQAYEGEKADQVRQVCARLAEAASIRSDYISYDEPIKRYLEEVAAFNPRKPVPKELMEMWRKHFEELDQSGRASEILPMRQIMYASLEKQIYPVEPGIHDLLSRILLEQRKFDATIEEVDYALRFNKYDVRLLHRKILALIGAQNLPEAERLINDITSRNKPLSMNPDIAALEGRIHRERWERTKEPSQLDAAFAAYYRAYQADTT